MTSRSLLRIANKVAAVSVKKITVIYILGLARSGTTYVSYELAGMLGCVSLGEIGKILETYDDPIEYQRYKDEKRICSCGRVPEECAFWGEILSPPNSKTHASYQDVLRKAAREFPDCAVFVDSSKTLPRLRKLQEAAASLRDELQVDIKVVHVVRHYFGVVRSYIKYRGRIRRSWILNNAFTYAFYWLAKNKEMETTINWMGIENVSVYYERCLFDGKKYYRRWLKELNLGEGQNSAIIHEASGNESFKSSYAADGEKRYDYRWFTELPSLFSFLFFLQFFYIRRIAAKWKN